MLLDSNAGVADTQNNSADSTETNNTFNTPATPPTSPKYFDDNGNFLDNWKELLPEDIRNEPTFNTVKSFPGLAQAYLSTKKMVGARPYKFPDQNSSEQDWNEFYKTQGRPETFKEYQIKRNEQIPEEIVKSEKIEPFLEKFHQFGLNQKQVGELMELYDNIEIEGIKGYQAQSSQKTEQEIAALRQKWGSDYNKKVENADMAFNLLPEELRTKITQSGMHNNALLAEILFEYSKSLDSEKFVSTDSGLGSDSFSNIESQMSQIQQNPAYRNPRHPDYSMLIQKYNMLAQKRSQLKG